MRFNNFSIFFCFLLLFSVAFSLKNVAAETLINNGSFETGDFTNWVSQYGNNTIDNNIQVGAYHGSYFLNSGNDGGITITPIYSCIQSSGYSTTGGKGCLNVSAYSNNSMDWQKICFNPAAGEDGNIILRRFNSSGIPNQNFAMTGTTVNVDDNACSFVNYRQYGTNGRFYFDYVTISRGSEYQPIISSINYKPSPVNYGDDINVYTITKGYAQKLQCGLSISNTNNLFISTDFVDNPSGIFENALENGDTNIFCQAFNVNGVYSDTNTVLITSQNKGSVSSLITAIDNTTRLSDQSFNSVSYSADLQPIDNSKNMVFVADNNTINNIDVNINIFNSDLSGKRYFVYTANGSDYAAGIWNFNDTLTYGTGINGIQKIWSDPDKYYKYKIQDSLTLYEKKYYRLVYVIPFKYWNTLSSGQSDWDLSLVPDLYTANNHSKDIYSISSFNNIRDQYREKLPAITSDVNSNFVLTVTADSNSAVNISLGKQLGGVDTTVAYTLSKTPLTISASTSADYPLIKTAVSSFNFINLADYALMERGYFISSLEIKDNLGNDLPTGIFDGNLSKQYLKEGKNFKIKSSLYNRNGSLDHLEATVYFNSVSAANQVAFFRKDMNDVADNAVYNLDWDVSGILDITGDYLGAGKSVIIKLRAINDKNNYFEIQESTLRFKEFPSDSGDISFNAEILNKIVGENPKLLVNMRIIAPETLRGIKFYLYDDNQSVFSPDYNATLWKDTDFSCNGFDCSFTKTFSDYVFPRQGFWHAKVNVLLTTEGESQQSLLTSRTLYFNINWIDFETERILQTVERTDYKYRNDEEIQLVLQLRDTKYKNLRTLINPYITLENCNAATAGNCLIQDLNFMPADFLYDNQTGYNYYFWRNIFANQNGTLLDDGNFYRFKAHIQDFSLQHSTNDIAVLAAKCKDGNYSTKFFENMLGTLNHFLFGCNAGLTTSAIVTTATNNSEEVRIKIDNTTTLTAPTQECSFCIVPDKNNVFVDGLKQPLLCGSWYKYNKAAIDGFDFYITNNNSDLSKTGINAQYLKINVPASIIQFNDLTLMKQSLETEYSTDIDSIGELIYYGANTLLTPTLNVLNTVPEGIVNSGLITNFGYDCNFSRPLDKTYIGGMVYFSVNGINVYNRSDYVERHTDLNSIDLKDFIEYSNYKKYSLPKNKTTVDIYVSDLTKILTTETNSPLVIDSTDSTAVINTQNLDLNKNSNFVKIPVLLKFDIITDLIYNGEINVIRRFVPITIKTSLSDSKNTFSDIGKLLIQNWFIIFVSVIFILYVATVYRKFKGGGNEINIINPARR